MLKKLKRCIIDFNESSYFQSVGLKKMKLNGKAEQSDIGDKKEYYEYYDEEDEHEEEESNGKNSKLTSEFPMGSIANKSEKPMSLNNVVELNQ